MLRGKLHVLLSTFELTFHRLKNMWLRYTTSHCFICFSLLTWRLFWFNMWGYLPRSFYFPHTLQRVPFIDLNLHFTPEWRKKKNCSSSNLSKSRGDLSAGISNTETEFAILFLLKVNLINHAYYPRIICWKFYIFMYYTTFLWIIRHCV